jgi:hypothetical protein
MRVDLSEMKSWADRDAVFFYSAEVFDDAETRYPVRIMIEGIAAALFEREVKLESYRDVVEALYRQELEVLAKQGRLTPENLQSTVNVVFLVNGHDGGQIRAGDIVVDDTREKLKAVARRLGRL